MKNAKRALALLSAGALAVGMLAGCGGGTSSSAAAGGDSATGESSAAGSSEGGEIRVVTFFAGSDQWAPVWKEVVADYMAANPGVTIIDESQPTAGANDLFRTKVQADVAAGTPADLVLFYNGADMTTLSDSGLFVDLNTYLEADPEWASHIKPDALAAGLGASQPFTNEAVYAWLSLGGRGATLPLSFMLLFAASKQLKALGKASIVPSLLNINEPVVFGCVAWNPLLMIPMWITAIVLPVITYLAQVTGMVAIPVEVFNMWYCPVFISSWLVNHSLSGLALTAINLAVAAMIFFPFFKIYDRQQLKLEQEENE